MEKRPPFTTWCVSENRAGSFWSGENRPAVACATRRRAQGKAYYEG